MKKILFMLMMGFTTFANAATVDQIIVFGDSLSDNGNIYNLTQKLHKVISSIPVIPKDPPYYQGRFSNGPVWAEDLAEGMQVPLVDYAYGGSWAEPLKDSKLNIPFNLGVQVDYYLMAAVTDHHKDQHLYVIWTGGNDYVDTREDVDEATTNVVNTIENNLDWLIYDGAKNVLVVNLPDLSNAPVVVNDGADRIQNVRQLVTLHNAKLATMLENMRKKYPDANIVAGDANTTFEDILQHPESYQLKNVKEACYDGNYWFKKLIDKNEIADAKKQQIDIMHTPSLRIAYLNAKLAETGEHTCDNQDEYLFWDQLHPTRVIHNLTAMSLAAQLAVGHIEGRAK